MASVNGINDVDFDIEKAKACADTYSMSVGVECAVIDTNGKTLYKAGRRQCEFCKKISSILDESQSCENAHIYGSYQAERFGGKYVFFCPMGLAHWVSPINVNGIMNGALLAGPVFMIDPDEFLLEEYIQKNNIQDKHIENIDELIREIPVIEPDRVNSMSELLYIVASHLSDPQSQAYEYEREAHEQQANISQYIHHIKTMGGDDTNISGYPLEKERELLSMISMGDKAGAQKLLNEIFGHIFFSTGGNFDVIKARVLELVVLLSRAALEGGADVELIFGLNYKYLNEINNFSTVEELTVWLSRIMTRFTDCVFNLTDVKHVDVIYKAVEYVRKNYMKKITLEEVASHVYLSPSYFSKIFKEEMKVNFNTYLNQKRIEMSKKLLLDDSIVLVDVSNLVGYEDQSYFSKVFKKLVGVSPGKYRDLRGQIRNVQQNENNTQDD